MKDIKKISTSQPSAEILTLIRKRDALCVYCRTVMLSQWDKTNQSKSPTLEHLNHRQDWDSVGSYMQEGRPVTEIVAVCCGACNSSRGAKPLREWFTTGYCIQRNINPSTVAEVVTKYLEKYEPD